MPSAPEKQPRARIDHILVKLHPEYNRNTLQNFIKSGYVTQSGRIIKKPNAEIELPTDFENATLEQLQNLGLTLDVPEKKTPPELKNLIIYEDDNVLVINKPTGLLSMKKGEFSLEPTLEDYGLIVHRLDRDTSGVVILAKNPATQSFLRKQFQDRKTHKTYYAIIPGHLKLDQAKIDLPISRNLKHPTTFLVDPNGKPSQTFYQVEQKTNNFSLVKLQPVTGRTHQLRVHLKYLGHPIVGDPVYGDNPEPSTRLFLHAYSLEITIPGAESGERRTFIAELPPEFNDFLRSH